MNDCFVSVLSDILNAPQPQIDNPNVIRMKDVNIYNAQKIIIKYIKYFNCVRNLFLV